MKQKRDKNQLFIILFALVLIVLPKGIDFLFGSQTDWLSQHSVFPEYFRDLFYQTGKLIPNFAPHLGGGQNVFNFAYYGLLNPVILLSYFFPFVKMIDYIQLSNIILILASGLLFYKWTQQYFSKKLSFVLSLLFLSSSPLIFHFHRQVMFVDYMPFLLLGFIGIDKYFQKGTRWLYTLSVFLMILTSYYYSVGGLIVMVIYGVFVYLKKTKKVTVKQFLLDGLKFSLPMIVGVLMACVLLLPIVYTLTNSRNTISETIELLFLFIPDLNLNRLLYGTYAVGLTIISVLALVMNCLEKKKENRFLNISLLIILLLPIFIYLLNGTLYIRNKVLIPFLPIIILNTGIFLKHLGTEKRNLLKVAVGLLIVTVLISNHKAYILSYIDIIITGIALVIYYITKKENILYGIVLTLSFLICFGANMTDSYVPKERYERIDNSTTQELIDKTLDKEPDVVRSNLLIEPSETVNKIYHPNYYQTSFYSSTFNSSYKEFYDNVFKNPIPYRNKLITAQSDNLLFDMFMGVKYITSTTDPGLGYELVEEKNGIGIYKNENVLPIGYATTNLISNETFDKMKYPHTIETLLANSVVKESDQETMEDHIQPVTLESESVTTGKNIIIEKKRDDYYIVDAMKKDKINIKVKNDTKNKIYIVTFRLSYNTGCSKPDQTITINGVTNKLTCRQWIYHNGNDHFEYVLSNVEDQTLNITLQQGRYRIKDLKVYELDYNAIQNVASQVDAWNIEKEKTVGDQLQGTIDVKQDGGYFITSIPYDKGFKAYIDGKETSIEKVNKAFLGFPIEKGQHEIKITYESPYLKIGKAVSLVGFLIFFAFLYLDWPRKKSLEN